MAKVDAIEFKGITRNRTKIGMEDGQCEDILNLRFRDGSWRPSGDGKLVFLMGKQQGDIPHVLNVYDRIFIHTNVYRHILGVRSGMLYWFADIEDGEFIPLKKEEPICEVDDSAGITYTQTGNLLVIISDTGGVNYALFNEIQNIYKVVSIDKNGSPDSRTLYPYGNVHLNLDCSEGAERLIRRETEKGRFGVEAQNDLYEPSTDDLYNYPETMHSEMIQAFSDAQGKNIFTRPFMAMVAVKLYDGTYAFASNPVLLWPREKISSGMYAPWTKTHPESKAPREIYDPDYGPDAEALPIDTSERGGFSYIPQGLGTRVSVNRAENPGESAFYETPVVLYHGKSVSRFTYRPISKDLLPVYAGGASTGTAKSGDGPQMVTEVRGADLLINIDNISVIKENKDLFTGIGIFITPEVDIFEMGADIYTGKTARERKNRMRKVADIEPNTYIWNTHVYDPGAGTDADFKCQTVHFAYCPLRRKIEDIRYDLLHSPFFLLRDYKPEELDGLQNELKVNLSAPEYKGILKTEILVQQPRFNGDALERRSYVPKVAYNYNGRLHLANYTSSIFYGYPADQMLFNNHSGVFNPNASSLGLSRFEETDTLHRCQFDRLPYVFADGSVTQYLNLPESFVAINVWLKTNKADVVVTRYIAPYTDDRVRPYFVEDFPAFICYPDSRAERMEIVVTQLKTDNGRPCCEQHRKTFTLTPHPFLNIAFFMTDNLMPISIASWISTTNQSYPEHQIVYLDNVLNPSIWRGREHIRNATEYFPNGLKVSATDNPLSFPYKNTYLVGSSEIKALCSNTIAVGTGQTGSAPLYVFCADGLYALFVDASGQMTYTNARVLARDVCNNPHSVTPIDAGVVFTTDRGLMMIAGEQVEEIGASAEGWPLEYVDTTAQTGRFTPRTAAKNVLTLISALPAELCDGINFLTFLQHAIINYNHNLHELMVSAPASTIRDTDMASEMTQLEQASQEMLEQANQQGSGTSLLGAGDDPAGTVTVPASGMVVHHNATPLSRYSYVRDREGNWTRRYFGADEYVNNFPTSYRVINGEWYKVDEEDNIENEHDNQFFAMSQPLKLESIGFKQALRFVVRGYFETQTEHKPAPELLPAEDAGNMLAQANQEVQSIFEFLE